jgi:plastocyanin
MRRAFFGSVVAGGILLLAAGCFSERGAATGPSADACTIRLEPDQFGSTLVAIRNFAFLPATVRIKAGGQVTWLNCESPGIPAHTSTADNGAWQSPLLDIGDTYAVTFATAGTFTYHCDPHPSMQASVIVDP